MYLRDANIKLTCIFFYTLLHFVKANLQSMCQAITKIIHPKNEIDINNNVNTNTQ